MKKMIGLFVAFLIAVSPVASSAATPLPTIRSETYVVMDAASGQVLLERGANSRMFPASITKILTSALTLEQVAKTGKTIDDTHIMTYEAVHSIDRGSTHIALTQEEVVTVRDLLNATMIESANDAANGLAEYTAGALAAFPGWMNQKAKELGARNSNFVNGSGLHSTEHYSTAYDMALITKWALQVDGFRDVFGATEYVVPPTNKQSSQRKMGTHHHMLVNSKYYYEGTTGGKLGWTPEAQHTLVTLAERDGLELICVVMRSSSQYEKYEDAAALLNAAFSDYSNSTMPVAQYAQSSIPVFEQEKQVGEVRITSTELSLARPASLAKADIKGELIAPAQYQKAEQIAPAIRFSDPTGKVLATIPLEWAYQELAEPIVPAFTPKEGQTMQQRFSAVGLWWAGLSGWQIAGLVLFLLFTTLLLIRHHNLRKRRRRRGRPSKFSAAADVIEVAPEFMRRPQQEFTAQEQLRSDALRRRNAQHPRNRGR